MSFRFKVGTIKKGIPLWVEAQLNDPEQIEEAIRAISEFSTELKQKITPRHGNVEPSEHPLNLIQASY